jgi:hypothetical protein
MLCQEGCNSRERATRSGRLVRPKPGIPELKDLVSTRIHPGLGLLEKSIFVKHNEYKIIMAIKIKKNSCLKKEIKLIKGQRFIASLNLKTNLPFDLSVVILGNSKPCQWNYLKLHLMGQRVVHSIVPLFW